MGQLIPIAKLADGEILADPTTEIASGQKDRPRSACARNWRLFAMVKSRTGYHRFCADLACAELTFGAVNATLARAQSTIGHQLADSVQPLAHQFYFIAWSIYQNWKKLLEQTYSS